MIKHLLRFFSAADSDNPKTVRAWRLTVSSAITVFALYVVWAIGLFSPVGFDGVAFASDIDAKIIVALEPVKLQLGVQDGYLKRLVKRDIREDIHAKCEELCDATEPRKRLRIRGDLEDLQDEHEKVADGKRYPEPDCEEL